MKNFSLLLVFITVTVSTVNAQQETGTVTDIDGNVYKTVIIGGQEWMAENLKVTHYRNGDAIPNVSDGSEWKKLSTGAYCTFENDEGNAVKYGYLYNWQAVGDQRNIAPEGWHVASDFEWKELEMSLGMSQTDADSTGWRGSDTGGRLKEEGTAHWITPNEGATNESGFSVRPGGFRESDYGLYEYSTYWATFWSTSVYNSESVWYRFMDYTKPTVYRNVTHKSSGLSVRCVRDNESSGTDDPAAKFNPAEVNVNTDVTLDASSSKGYGLEFRWDFDGDGSYDTDYSSFNSVTHQYAKDGSYNAKLEIKDNEGRTSTSENIIVILPTTGTMTDKDGNVYKTVKIGEQWWMAENLKVTHYHNGDAIPNVTDETDWKKLKTGAYSAYENDESKVAVSGYLYNWYAVVDSRNLAPEGWHIPTHEDWDVLGAIGGLKLKEAGFDHWVESIDRTGGTNESGFTALPGGYRGGFGFKEYNYFAGFWSTRGDEKFKNQAWMLGLKYDWLGINRRTEPMMNGYSVRLIKNK